MAAIRLVCLGPVSRNGDRTLTSSDYYEKSDAERHLVHKLDCGILIAIVFSYIMKAIDQSK